MPHDCLRWPTLASCVLVAARDGYRVVHSTAELDLSPGSHQVFPGDGSDGKALTDGDGPLRLIAPDQSRPVRRVVSSKVIPAS